MKNKLLILLVLFFAAKKKGNTVYAKNAIHLNDKDFAKGDKIGEFVAFTDNNLAVVNWNGILLELNPNDIEIK